KLTKWMIDELNSSYGVFIMKHMESYQGLDNWECGLEAQGEKLDKQIRGMRRKYITKMLLSDVNKLKTKVIKEAAEFYVNYTKQQKEAMLENSSKATYKYFKDLV
ncbi:hypothetical protein OC714_02545, partial [Candidatus Phytoplasma australasiaticum]|uniref:hypothetical protein n=1 Tax=Candidatus Phytoplasma australasiaticum TaxID=2754999 RepID=UPI0030E99A01